MIREKEQRGLEVGLAISSILLLLLSFHFSGIKDFTIFGNLNFALWDIAALFIVPICFYYLFVQKLRIPRHFSLPATLILLILIWNGFEALSSPLELRGFTMFLLMIRNAFIFLAVVLATTQIRDIAKLNRIIFFIGVAISLISLFLFIKAYTGLTPEVKSRRPFGGSILMLDQGRFPRLIGFAYDPNFYSLWISISLFCGLGEKKVTKIIKYPGICIILVALLAALSRSFFIFLYISLLILFFILFFTGKLKLGLRYVFTLIFFGLLIVAFFLLIRQGFYNPLQILLKRYSIIGHSPRFLMWKKTLAHFENVIIGHGLRSTEAILGNYSHNSYLDILFENGIFGLFLWALFTYFSTRKYIRIIRTTPELIPWLHCWVLILLFFTSFSLAYNPFFWFLSAFAWSQNQSKYKNHNKLLEKHNLHNIQQNINYSIKY